jgi:hypothetical protein
MNNEITGIFAFFHFDAFHFGIEFWFIAQRSELVMAISITLGFVWKIVSGADNELLGQVLSFVFDFEKAWLELLFFLAFDLPQES